MITAARQNIPEGFMLGVIRDPDEGHLIRIANQEFFDNYRNKTDPGKILARGWIGSFKTPENRYFNAHTEAEHGYGPVLYDAAIIMATKFGGGLVSSLCKSVLTEGPWETSDEAAGVYKFLYNSRPDVTKRSLTQNELVRIQKDFKSRADIMQEKPELFAVYVLNKRLSSLGPVWPGTKF